MSQYYTLTDTVVTHHGGSDESKVKTLTRSLPQFQRFRRTNQRPQAQDSASAIVLWIDRLSDARDQVFGASDVSGGDARS